MELLLQKKVSLSEDQNVAKAASVHAGTESSKPPMIEPPSPSAALFDLTVSGQSESSSQVFDPFFWVGT